MTESTSRLCNKVVLTQLCSSWLIAKTLAVQVLQALHMHLLKLCAVTLGYHTSGQAVVITLNQAASKASHQIFDQASDQASAEAGDHAADKASGPVAA